MTDTRIAPFQRLAREEPTPWHYRTKRNGHRTHDATIAALSWPRYVSAVDAGCADGELGARVAPRCDRYLGLDCAGPAVATARQRLAHLPQACVRQCFLPYRWPKRRADLILLSEILYYLETDEVDALAEALHSTLLPGGEIVIVNWRGETEAPLSGREATSRLVGALGGWCRVARARRTSEFDLVLLQRPSQSDEREPAVFP